MKARAACAQRLTLWQQATIEITRRDHSVIACSLHVHKCAIVRAHPVRGESHIQRHADREVATVALLRTKNGSDISTGELLLQSLLDVLDSDDVILSKRLINLNER